MIFLWVIWLSFENICSGYLPFFFLLKKLNDFFESVLFSDFFFFFFFCFWGLHLELSASVYSELYPRRLAEELNGIFRGSSSHNVVSGLGLPFSLPHFFLIINLLWYIYIKSLSISFLISLSFSFLPYRFIVYISWNLGLSFCGIPEWENKWVSASLSVSCTWTLSFYLFCPIPLCF